ncbi:MAG: hypothetical protein ACKVRP_09890 [Bacteroidota bacterium]
MKFLSLDTFITGSRDFESKQYAILQGIQSYYNEFHHNRLYPGLGELVELFNILRNFMEKKDELESKLPHRLTELDLEQQKAIFEPVANSGGDFARAAELIEWSLPLLKKTIDEGLSIFHFVEEHITIEGVGLMPVYREEGYWFVPEAGTAKLHLLRYEVSLFTSANEQFRTLKTRLLETLEQSYVRQSPESLKLELIARYHDLPNPATFACETDMEFPYAETFLPVAKRKLMSQLFS